jgi:hypothetical protein
MKTKEEKLSYQREYYKKHRGKLKKFSTEYNKVHRKECNKAVKKWSDNNKDKARHSQLMYYFGISLEEYNEIFIKQKGCCAICGRHQTEFKKVLFVDHNHTTGKVRGLLCMTCNLLIGRAKENITILEKALIYLNENKKGGE